MWGGEGEEGICWCWLDGEGRRDKLVVLLLGDCGDNDDDDNDHNEEHDADNDHGQLHVLAAHLALERGGLLLEHRRAVRQVLCAVNEILGLGLVAQRLVDVVLHDSGHLIDLLLDVAHTAAHTANGYVKTNSQMICFTGGMG